MPPLFSAAYAPLLEKIYQDASAHKALYQGKKLVIKYGGHAMAKKLSSHAAVGPEEGAFYTTLKALKGLGFHLILVHGGGPQMGAVLESMHKSSTFVDGLRVTDETTMQVAEMVLAGAVNKSLVKKVQQIGLKAVGLCGKDADMVCAQKYRLPVAQGSSAGSQGRECVVDLGFVGEPKKVDPSLITLLLQKDIIPILAPIAADEEGQSYNINADVFAGAIAGACHADALLFLTDVEGVLNKEKQLLPKLTLAQAEDFITDGTISAGMIPKMRTAMTAIQKGAQRVVILSGKDPYALFKAALGHSPSGEGESCGTQIVG